MMRMLLTLTIEGEPRRVHVPLPGSPASEDTRREVAALFDGLETANTQKRLSEFIVRHWGQGDVETVVNLLLSLSYVRDVRDVRMNTYIPQSQYLQAHRL